MHGRRHGGPGQLENTDCSQQALRLALHAAGNGSGLFDQRRILLGNFIHLRDRQIELPDAGALLRGHVRIGVLIPYQISLLRRPVNRFSGGADPGRITRNRFENRPLVLNDQSIVVHGLERRVYGIQTDEAGAADYQHDDR